MTLLKVCDRHCKVKLLLLSRRYDNGLYNSRMYVLRVKTYSSIFYGSIVLN